MTTGNIFSWGDNRRGQLGINSDSRSITFPFQMKKFNSNENRIVKIACGFEHVIALSANGTLYVWGSSDCGVLGFETNTDVKEPMKMDEFLFENNKIVSISAGINFFLFI